MKLCHCANAARDTIDNERMYRCSGCGGATPTASPPTIDQVRAVAHAASGFLNAFLGAYVISEPDLWTPSNRQESAGRRQKGWVSDQVLKAAENKSLRQKRAWAAVAWDQLRLALDHLRRADEALGMIDIVEGRHETDTGPEGNDLARAIVNERLQPGDELPPGLRHLEGPIAARARRHQRGEL